MLLVRSKPSPEQIEDFCKKAKGSWSVRSDEQFIVHEGHGFLSYCVDFASHDFILLKMYGDGKYWRDKVCDFVTNYRDFMKFKRVLFYTRRSWRAIARQLSLEGYKIEKRMTQILPDGTVEHGLSIDVDELIKEREGS